MNKKIKSFKRYFGLLVLTIMVASPVSAQTELTTDMIWQEGTHWLYPFRITMDFYGREVGYYLMECRLVKDNYGIHRDSYLTIESRTNLKADSALNHTWNYNWGGLGLDIKVDDNKIIGAYEPVSQSDTASCTYLLYDFDTWNSGNTIRFEESEGVDDEKYTKDVVLGDAERVITDPEGKYYTYAFSGMGDYNLPYYYIKNIGRVQDATIQNLVYFDAPYVFWDEEYGGPDGIQALKIWHPDLGVLYQHPEYDRYMSLTSGIESVEADEAQGEPVITATDGAVTITTEDLTQVTVCTPTGTVVRREMIAGTVSYPLAPGIYIVRAGSVTRKVRV